MKTFAASLAVALLLVAGVYYRAHRHIDTSAINQDEIVQLKIYSVRPLPSQLGEKHQDTFHSFPIMGSAEVSGKTGFIDLISTVNRDLLPHVSNHCVFEPRHGLSIAYKNKTIDYLICYHCGDVTEYEGNVLKRTFTLRGAPPSFGTASKAALDKVLHDAGVPLAP